MDRDAALGALSQPAVDPPGVLASPAQGRLQRISEELQAVSPSQADGGKTEARRAQAEQAMTAERDALFNELTQAYLRDVERELKAVLAELSMKYGSAESDLRESVVTFVSSRIRESANYRAPRVIRIQLIRATLAEEPGRRREIALSMDLEARLRAERAVLEEELADNDKRFEIDLSRLLQEHASAQDAATRALQAEMGAAKARLEAAVVTRLQNRLADADRKQLPALLESADYRVFAAPKISTEGVGLTVQAKMPSGPLTKVSLQTLDLKLNTWAEVQGYKLTNDRDRASDRTAEFIAWLNQQSP